MSRGSSWSWIQASHFPCLQYAGASHNEAGSTQRYFFIVRQLPDGGEGFTHDAGEPLVDLFLGPEKAGKILHPFEIADGHTTCIGEYIWHDHNALLLQDIVSCRRGLAICAFEYDL